MQSRRNGSGLMGDACGNQAESITHATTQSVAHGDQGDSPRHIGSPSQSGLCGAARTTSSGAGKDGLPSIIQSVGLLPKITLDWPSQPCWPNRQKHWQNTRESRGVQKEAAYYTARALKWRKPYRDPRGVHLSLTFCAPSKRRYDLDNALAAMKGAIDGLSACLGVDDSLFSYTLRRGDPSKDGGVIVEASIT